MKYQQASKLEYVLYMYTAHEHLKYMYTGNFGIIFL